ERNDFSEGVEDLPLFDISLVPVVEEAEEMELEAEEMEGAFLDALYEEYKRDKDESSSVTWNRIVKEKHMREDIKSTLLSLNLYDASFPTLRQKWAQYKRQGFFEELNAIYPLKREAYYDHGFWSALYRTQDEGIRQLLQEIKGTDSTINSPQTLFRSYQKLKGAVEPDFWVQNLARVEEALNQKGFQNLNRLDLGQLSELTRDALQHRPDGHEIALAEILSMMQDRVKQAVREKDIMTLKQLVTTYYDYYDRRTQLARKYVPKLENA
ncbi:unnamed protein product, partial [marine sediment metagenome]